MNFFQIRSIILKWSLVIIFSFLSTMKLCGQSRDKTEAIVRRVADQVIKKTSFRFENIKTGKKYKTTENLSPKMNIKPASRLNRWVYPNGVLNLGMLQVGKVLKEDKYTNYVLRNFSFIFSNLDYFKKKYESGEQEVAYSGFFQMDSPNFCCTMGAALIEINKIVDKPEYRSYIDRAAQWIVEDQDRLQDGTLARTRPRNMTMWGDDLYVSVVFLARMGKLTGDDKYFDFAIKQVKSFNNHLYDPATGLMFHNWYSDIDMNGVAHWGRVNGWIMMAQVELLSHLPENYPNRDKLIHLLLRQIVGASRYQDESGLWHQILDKPDSYLESSVTAIFVYSIAKAVNGGWIPHSYLSVAKKGWKGLQTNINKFGEVEDVCVGTGIQDNIQFYYNRPAELNDWHGWGPVLLAGSELIKAADK